ncbi:restriction system-associated AAA family ATPase [Spirosoma sp. HMF3257]|uniref:ATPase AAA-type core domain-containing protein n=1 Tax=Spirosoma telluris TaxID=2183553 RepID=A0A327NRR6_9BACT|nr:restriction system-associated AAA family ATPase [Spirosoma telluris]RAI76646.1 hypothetical protein HMF3257_25245 [Spirosoma telluris]
MRIRRIKLIDIEHRPLLHGLELEFTNPTDAEGIVSQCFVGVNGSGKSQLLETFAEIFQYLDRRYRTYNRPKGIVIAPLGFEIEYAIQKNGEWIEVQIQQKKSSKAPIVQTLNEYGDWEYANQTMIESLLPQKVVGYTSGANETLSIPFAEYYDEYDSYTADRTHKAESRDLPDYEPRFYLMDYSTNIGVVVSNLLLSSSDRLSEILGKIKISGLRSFQLIIRLNGRKKIDTTTNLDSWIERLKKSATCYEFDDSKKNHRLDFLNTQATRQALTHHFKTPLDLYTALYKLELLNNLLVEKRYRSEIKKQRKQRRLVIKPPTVPEQDKVLSYNEVQLLNKDGKPLDYISLSDGEHQFLNIFGTVLMTDYTNSLFLLDEPETHFNPKWRREFIKELNLLTNGRIQAYLITSHSPFIVSDSKREFVHVFSNENGKLKITTPDKETYGSDFNYVLRVAFGMKEEETVAQKSLEEMQELQQSSNAQAIEERLDDFGDSTEKFYLYKRIEELKEQQGK